MSHHMVCRLDFCMLEQSGESGQTGNREKCGKKSTVFATSFYQSQHFYSEHSEKEARISQKTQEQTETFYFNLQIIQLHQVWSHRGKKRGKPSLKPYLKHLKLKSLHLPVPPHFLCLPSQWTPSESRSIHLLL